ncbi:hypothetical protein ES703_118337 [subsurface metagenome]
MKSGISIKLKLIRFMHRLGFRIPREHGLTLIWLSALFLGTGLSVLEAFDIIGLLIALCFSSLVFVSYDAIKHTMQTKFSKIIWVPWIFIFTIGSLLLFLRPRWQLLIIIVLIAVNFSFWAILRWKILGNPIIELIIGTLGLTLQVSLIQIAAFKSINDSDFLRILATWWLLAGMSVVVILQAQSRRYNYFFSSIPFNTWILFLVTLVPIFLFQIFPLILAYVLIEPTIESSAYSMPLQRKIELELQIGGALMSLLGLIEIALQIVRA